MIIIREDPDGSDTSIETTSDMDADIVALTVEHELGMKVKSSVISRDMADTLVYANMSDSELNSRLERSDLASLATVPVSSNREMMDFDHYGRVDACPVVDRSDEAEVEGGDEMESEVEEGDQSRETLTSTSTSTPGSSQHTSASQKSFALMPSQVTCSNQFTLLQCWRKAGSEGAYPVMQSSGGSESEQSFSQGSATPSGQYKLSELATKITENMNLRCIDLSGSTRPCLQKVSLPGRIPMKHVPKPGAPFSKAPRGALTRPKATEMTAENQVLSSIDIKRLDPPNQYTVSEMRQFCRALGRSRQLKGEMITWLKSKLEMSGLL